MLKASFKIKNKTDFVIRRITSAILFLAVLTTNAVCLTAGKGGTDSQAAEYVEPYIRVGIVMDEEEETHYSVTAAEGFSFGYIDFVTDEFTVLGSTSEKVINADLDYLFYVEITSYSNGDQIYDFSDPLTLMELEAFIGGYGLLLFPAYADGFCYRAGPYSTAEEASAYVDMIVNDVNAFNETGASVSLGISVKASSEHSVLLTDEYGRAVFSFSSSSENIATAVSAVDEGQGAAYMTAGSNVFPGVIEFRRCTNGYEALTVINILPLETYVGCVDTSEIYTTWPLETHKVFAVVVRTFTVRSGTRHGDAYCDFCSTTCCQAYRGIARVNDTIREAVDATRGLVLSSEGHMVRCYYYAVSGGSTVSSIQGWGGEYYPYLQAVATPWERYRDYGRYTSKATWHREFTGAELYRLLSASGSHPALKGEIVDVHIDEFCENSSFVFKVTYTDIYGNTSSVQKTNSIRNQLGLNSGNFVVGKNGDTVTYPEYSLDCYPSLYSEEYNGFEDYFTYGEAGLQVISSSGIASAFSLNNSSVLLGDGSVVSLPDKTVKILTSSQTLKINENGLPDILDGKTVCTQKTITLSGAEGKFIFEGKGWGHGIGFSQYGIWDMCTLGYDFETILKYYLKGVEIVHMNDLGT